MGASPPGILKRRGRACPCPELLREGSGELSRESVRALHLAISSHWRTGGQDRVVGLSSGLVVGTIRYSPTNSTGRQWSSDGRATGKQLSINSHPNEGGMSGEGIKRGCTSLGSGLLTLINRREFSNKSRIFCCPI